MATDPAAHATARTGRRRAERPPSERDLDVSPLPGTGAPTAFRAVARIDVDRRGRERQVITYDARWPDGWVRVDVDLVDLMDNRAPADFAAARDAMLADCPRIGSGSWVRNPSAGRTDHAAAAPQPWADARPFPAGARYFRQIHRGRYKPFRGGYRLTYEVMLEPGVTRVVRLHDRWEALGAWAGRDSMECDYTVSRLHNEGRHDEWVLHPWGTTETIAEILSPAAPAD